MKAGSALLLLGLSVVASASAALVGCSDTSGSDGASSESAVVLGTPPDAGEAPDASAPDEDASAATDAAAPASPPGPSTTTFTASLTAIGLDINNLPALHDLDMSKKMRVMQTFTKSMGTTCAGCHDLSDYSKPTPQKDVATSAWNDIVVKMTMGDGSPVYCDSCHYGKFHFLDRSGGKAAIMDWMQANFVDQLKRKDAQPTQCSSCHNPVPTLDNGY